jgi:hypothetical protein
LISICVQVFFAPLRQGFHDFGQVLVGFKTVREQRDAQSLKRCAGSASRLAVVHVSGTAFAGVL